MKVHVVLKSYFDDYLETRETVVDKVFLTWEAATSYVESQDNVNKYFIEEHQVA